MKKFLSYFSPFERGLWLLSTVAVVLIVLLGSRVLLLDFLSSDGHLLFRVPRQRFVRLL